MKKNIVIKVDTEKDFDETATTIEQSFNIEEKIYLSDGSIEYKVFPREYSRRVKYTEEQARIIIRKYKIFLNDYNNGIPSTWYHLREGRKIGLSKKQVLTILKNAGILQSELHNTHRNKLEEEVKNA